MKNDEPFYGVKDHQREAAKIRSNKKNKKKRERHNEIKEMIGGGIIGKYVLSSTYK
jgi:hypothetical protein